MNMEYRIPTFHDRHEIIKLDTLEGIANCENADLVVNYFFIVRS